MRQFLKFLPVFVFFGFFVIILSSSDVDARPAQEDTQLKNYDRLMNIFNEIQTNHDEHLKSDRAATEQDMNARGAEVDIMQRTHDADNANAAALAGQVKNVDTATNWMNREDYVCSLMSVSQSASSAKQSAEQNYDLELAERNKVIAGEPGTKTENGLVDFQNKLHEQMQSLDSSRFSMGNLIGQYTIPTGGVADQKLAYMQDLLYARVPVYLGEDLKNSPDTEVKNAVVAADRLRAEMSIGQSIFSRIKANRASNKGNGRAIQFQKEIMEANGYSGAYLQKILTPDASYRAQLEAMTVGQFGTKYMQEKLIDKDTNYGAGILWNLMLSNLIQMEQYALLESIALATSANVIATREEAIKDVNARISAKNAGQ